MKRYIITLSTLILLIFALSVSLILFFQNEATTAINFDRLYPTIIPYEKLDQHVREDAQAYFFCTTTSVNCVYVYKDILVPLMNNAGVDRFEQIFFVEASILEKDILPSAMLQRLGFEEMPAFVLLRKDQNRIVFENVYAWNDATPITLGRLKQWMLDNDLWLSSYQD
jgi:hypothetical protein